MTPTMTHAPEPAPNPYPTQVPPLEVLASVDTRDARAVLDLLAEATEACLNHPDRRGACTQLPHDRPAGRLLMTGDLHDHAANLRRIIKLARLDESPDHHVVLHEITHGPQVSAAGVDMSVCTLIRIAGLKVAYPLQVHLMLANHDLAQAIDEPILKNGVSCIDPFNHAIDQLYPEHSDAVRQAVSAFIKSFNLLIRCDNGIGCCHSLPAARWIEHFDPTVIDRVPTEEDLQPGGSAYQMVWGRYHKQPITDELGEMLYVRQFLLGHQPADMGYERQTRNSMILASDHGHGVALPVELDREYNQDLLEAAIVRLAGVTA